jgi:diguanylate cyclase (GGDEF)-like protein
VDVLTGLPNRRHAQLVLDAQFAAAVRGRPLAVLMFDLDNFKRVNDQHGHVAGDGALRVFAELLRQNTRRMDLSARFGGEEFISILGDCRLPSAIALADRIRSSTESLVFPWGSVTVSVGVAAYEPGMGSYEVLLAAADRALYGSKQGGKNRVTGAVPMPAEAQRPRAARPAAPVASSQGRGETVLLVDDDPDTLRLIGKLLRRAGYRVEETEDPGAVVRRFGTGVPPDLLIADIMMPRMNGLTLADRIATTHPGVRVVYLSAFVGQEVSWAGLPGAVTGFVAKPIDPQALLAMTRDVLDRAVPEG